MAENGESGGGPPIPRTTPPRPKVPARPAATASTEPKIMKVAVKTPKEEVRGAREQLRPAGEGRARLEGGVGMAAQDLRQRREETVLQEA